MTCESIRPLLVGFHFGLSDPEEYAAIDAHVMECKACLRELLDLKRAIERSDEAPRPSDVARLRLRAAVADVVVPAPARAPRRRWERPLAFAFAASALLCSMAAMRSLTSGPGNPPFALRSPDSR